MGFITEFIFRPFGLEGRFKKIVFILFLFGLITLTMLAQMDIIGFFKISDVLFNIFIIDKAFYIGYLNIIFLVWASLLLLHKKGEIR